MTVSSSAIKKYSKSALKSNVINSLVAVTILLSVWFICSNLSAVFGMFVISVVSNVLYLIFCFLFLAPLFFGCMRYFWRMLCGVCDSPIILFHYFSSFSLYFKAINIIFRLSLRIAVYYCIFSFPVYVLRLITGTWLYSVLDMPIPIWTVNLSNLVNFIRLIAIFATLFSAFKFYLAPMLFVSDENLDVAEAIHLSTVISKNSLLDFVFLLFSFLGWILLSVTTLPLIFTIPYFILAYLVHSSCAVKAFNDEIAKMNQDDIPTFIAGV